MLIKFKPEDKYKIKLQSPSKSFWSTFKKAYLIKKDFKNFWQKLNKDSFDKDLVQITNKFLYSESSKWVSKFWNHCQINHYKSIAGLSSEDAIRKNIDDYARHIFFSKEDINNVCNEISKNKSLNFNCFKKIEKLNMYESISYNLATACLYLRIYDFFNEYNDSINKNIYKKFSHDIDIDNKQINQHLLFSLIEAEKISRLVNITNKNLKVLEFGAGYGRTANIFLSISENVKYVIADIPPSVCISYNELKHNYPNKRFIQAFDVNSSKEMKDTIDNNDVIYIFPHQLNLIEKKYFDLSIMIGIILEMNPIDVKRYMSFVNLLSKSLYIKNFLYAGLPYSFYKVYRQNINDDYFISKDWSQIFLDIGLETDNIAHSGFLIN